MQDSTHEMVDFVNLGFGPDRPMLLMERVWNPPQRPEQLQSRHFHRGMEIVRCDGGNGLWIVGSSVVPVERGDTLVLYPGVLHGARALAPGFHVRIAYYEPVLVFAGALEQDDVEARRRLMLPPHIVRVGADVPSRLAIYARLVLDELADGASGTPAAALRHLLRLVHVEVVRATAGEATARGALPVPDHDALARLSPALSYIVEHVYELPGIGYLAGLCNMSASTFRRAIVAAFGKPPRDYIIEFKINTAKALLRDEARPVSLVSDSVGYASLSSFNRHFKELVGVTPNEWRAKESRSGGPGA